MALSTTPPDTQYFRCFQVVPFPLISLPRGFGAIKLCPDTYFRNWENASNPEESVYVSREFRTKILHDCFEPVTMSAAGRHQAAFCWRVISPVSWETVYQHFPSSHGIAPADHQVVPWLRLQDLAFGWANSPRIVPKNDRGALLMLGDAGIAKLPPPHGGACAVGTYQCLAQLSYFAMISKKSWVITLPDNERNDRLCPPDMVFLTVQ